MEVIETNVILPVNQSFLIWELGLKNNKWVINSHDRYELNYIVDAYGKRFVAGNVSKFIPGDLVFMAPGVPHCWEVDNKDMDPRAIIIHFNKDFFEKAVSHLPELGFLQSLIHRSKQGLLIKTRDAEKVKQSFSDLIKSGNSFENLIRILKLFKTLSDAEDIRTIGNSEFKWDFELPKNQRLKKVYEYVFYNFQKNISLQEIASLIGLSKGAFCTFFKKSTKKSFSGFIKEVRIRYACKLLLEDTDSPVSRICFESGYNNFANFNRQFKEITNHSPTEYRQNAL